MNDLDQEMLFSWVDGSEVVYVNWAYYEPNNSGDEDCVEMYINDVRHYRPAFLDVFNTWVFHGWMDLMSCMSTGLTMNLTTAVMMKIV